jgi:hypothetical protein
MKKLIYVLMILAVTSMAIGEVVELSKYLILTEKTTNNEIDKHSVSIMYGPPAYAQVKYYTLDSEGKRARKVIIEIKNGSNDPESITANCTGPGEPWLLCLGAGTCFNDCNEASFFTAYMESIGLTLKTRTDAVINNSASKLYDTQDTP